MVQLFAELLKDATGTLPLKGAKKTVVYEMHSQRTMANRTRVSAAFRNDVSTRSCAVLVTSDVSARGVDYPGVTRVIQLGVPSSGDVYTHRVGRTGRAGRAGRGDLVLMAWEMGFLRRELGDVGLKPLKMDDLKEEIVALIDESKDASSSSSSSESRSTALTTYTRAALSEIDTVSAEIAHNLAASDMDATAGALMSTLGFYLGRLQQLGCRSDDMVNGMQSFFKEMCGLSEPLHLSRKMLELLGGGSRTGMQSRSGGRGFRSTRGGGYGSGGSRSGSDRNVRGGSYGSSSARREGGYGSSSTRREGGYGPSSSPSSSFGRSSYAKPAYSSYDKPSYSSYDKPSYSSSTPSSYGSREGRSSSYTPRSSSSDSYSPGGYGSRGLRGGFGNSPMKKRTWDDDE